MTDKVIQNFVTQINRLMPQDVDADTTMLNVDSEGHVINFNCKIHRPIRQGDVPRFIHEVKPDIVTKLSANPITPVFRKFNLTLRYTYRDFCLQNQIVITLFPGEY
jgi:hypothetical protein